MVSTLSFLFGFIEFVLLVPVAIDATFKCFTNESNMIMYQNNPEKEALLPTIRLIQGYYPSQHAMQYAAYVYLTEKIGINVTMYPMSDPNALAIFAANGSLVPAYPNFYFKWIEENKYDLLFETWHYPNTESYFLSDKVEDGGLSDVVAELGLFVPQWVYDNSPNWLIPSYLVSDEEIRQKYIDAATLNSSKDWIQFALNQSSDDSTVELFGTPSYDKPSIFACCSHYTLSEIAERISNGLLNGTWNVVILGSEAILSEFMIDLYTKHLPFIAAHYSPHPDFFKVINQSTDEIMKFEKISLPRNPSNSVNDECFLNGRCAFPLSALSKIGNPRLKETFPEVLKFLRKFTMNANDVNKITGIQHDIAYSEDSIYANETQHLSQHEIWQFAVCEWMKSADPIGWEIDIIRYDCWDGTSLEQCVSVQDTTTATILLIVGSVVILVILIAVIYKTITFCKEFQSTFGNNSTLIAHEKRRLFISMFNDIFALLLGVADAATDILSAIDVTYTYQNNAHSYSKSFVIIYFSLAVIVLFIAAIHTMITLKNVFYAFNELKNGMVLAEIEESEYDKGNMKKEIDRLLFKKEILTRNVQQQSVTIFVVICEDLPFLILNLYALFASSGSNSQLSAFVMGSLVCNCLNFGYKARIFKEFFSNLQEKNEIKKSVATLTNVSSESRKSPKHRNVNSILPEQ